jgi:ElaB/YqjD/DUF883 family membrane-anchored ribosome-binding protein
MSVQEADVRLKDGRANGSAVSTEDLSKLQDEIKGLEVSQAAQAATLAGAQATQAAMHAATWSTMAAGAGGLIVGILLGSAIVKAARR